MSVFSRIFDSLSEYEDDDLWRTLYKLYGPLLQLSLMFPSYRPSQLPLTITVMLIYVATLPGHLVLLAISVVKMARENFALSSLLAIYWFLLLYCVFAIVQFSVPYYRESCAMNHRYLGGDIGKYSHGDIYKEDRPLKIEKEMFQQTLRFLVVPGFFGIGASILFFLPYLNKDNTSVVYTATGVNTNLPIPAYYPFDTDKGVGHFVALGAQLVTASGVALVLISSAMLLLRVSVRLRLEYKILNYALDTLFRRASIVYRKRNPHLLGRTNLRDPRFQQCVGICLRDCVVHHHNILKLMKGFGTVTCWPAAAGYGVVCLVLAPTLFNILMAMSAGDHEKLIVFSLLGIGEVGILLLLSVIGESVTSDSQELRDNLYNTDWYDIDVKNRKIMLNFQVGANEPVVMMAGVNTTISLETFSSIMNTAYSFFNLINANME